MPSSSPASAAPLRLLLVDDDLLAARLLRAQLDRPGRVKADVASSPEEGVERLARGSYDALVTDLMRLVATSPPGRTPSVRSKGQVDRQGRETARSWKCLLAGVPGAFRQHRRRRPPAFLDRDPRTRTRSEARVANAHPPL